MKKRNAIIIVGVFAVLIIFFIIRFNGGPSDSGEITVLAQKGVFRSEITASGELFAKKSVDIMGPKDMRQVHIWETTITDIIEEGTVVEKGDYIARLNQSELDQKIEKKRTDLKVSTSAFETAKIDTTMELRKARDDMENMQYEIEKQRLVVKNSQFEPPAVVKEKKMGLERAEKRYKRAQENYELRVNKAKARMQWAEIRVQNDQDRLDFLVEVSEQFIIKAPEAGMLIYKRDWGGNKIAQGGRVAAWNPTVATLPDLTKMVSKTFINEVDINTVQQGQEVEIGLDAFPDKHLTGTVLEVANMGQQRPNSDAKLFEILIDINESDTTLRPGMTTSNKIVAEVVEDVLFIPVEGVHSQGDSITYVVKGGSRVKQEVLLGKSNADEVIILAGLEEGERIYLSDPEGLENDKVKLLPTDIKSKALTKKD